MECKVCPCALSMVMAKQPFKGYCLLWNLNGNVVSDGWSGILGTKWISPLCAPTAISTSTVFLLQERMMHLVPFISSGSFIDLSSITGIPIFNDRVCCGSPETSMEFKNSAGNLTDCSSSTIEFTDCDCRLRNSGHQNVIHFHCTIIVGGQNCTLH